MRIYFPQNEKNVSQEYFPRNENISHKMRKNVSQEYFPPDPTMQPVSAFLLGSTVANAGNTWTPRRIGYWRTLSYYEQWEMEMYKFLKPSKRKLSFQKKWIRRNQILLCGVCTAHMSSFFVSVKAFLLQIYQRITS